MKLGSTAWLVAQGLQRCLRTKSVRDFPALRSRSYQPQKLIGSPQAVQPRRGTAKQRPRATYCSTPSGVCHTMANGVEPFGHPSVSDQL